MANISGLLGTAGGKNGTGFTGPQEADINTPTTGAQANEQYANAQAGLANQQAFLQATQPGGLAALQSQQGLLSNLQAASQGQGPNPALAQLNQTTGQNVANQAALMAGQRGASANTGLMARQAAQAGAGIQQNAIGQAATLVAQQQLAARQQLMAQQNQMVGQQAGATTGYSQAAQGEQSNILNAINAQNNAKVGMQSNLNNANAGLIGQTMAQQASIGSSMSGAMGSMMGGGAEGGKVSDFPMIQAPSKMAAGGPINVPIQPMAALSAPAEGPASNVGQFFSGNFSTNAVSSGASPDIGSVSMAAMPKGGMKGPETKGGAPTDTAPTGGGESPEGGGAISGPEAYSRQTPSDYSNQASFDQAIPFMRGGTVPALLSPGERYLSPDKVEQVKKGQANPIRDGKKVPGKPKVAGAKNDYANDTVPAQLEEGGIVIPRSITQGKNPEERSIDFVRKCLAKNGSIPKKSK